MQISTIQIGITDVQGGIQWHLQDEMAVMKDGIQLQGAKA